MQSLTYVIGKDKRNLVDDIQNFKIDFDDSNYNWVQARQYEDGMRQVFVTMKNEDGSPFDLTGCNYWFEGILPDGVHKILDANHGVAIDPVNGQFRFDMPKQAFSVAGSYVQAFFRIMKDGASITTLEFDLQVLADKVISGLVPRDYITPFEDLLNSLNKMGTDTQTMLQNLQKQISDLETKITQDGLFTQAEADAFKQTIQDVVTERLAEFQTTYQDDVAKMNAQIETLNQNGYRVLPYKMVSGTTDPVGVNGTISENQIEHLATIGASLALVDMVNIQSATDANPTKSYGHEMQRVIDLCKKHSVPIQMLKPHLGINWSDNFYRANYNPTDVISAMKNWGSILMSYADICNSNNIPILCIECEHYILTQNKYLDYWTDIINQIRQKYQNLKLTAAYMNFEIVDPEHKDLLQKLDIIGLNVYPGYIIDSYDESLPVSYLVQAFYNTVTGENIAADIDQVCDELQKPALITETGCIPTMGGLAALIPSDYDSSKGANDYEVTAYLMKALFRFMQEDRNIIGFAWWHLNKPFSFFDDSNSTDNLSIAEQALKSYIERKLI
ncbi:BppU family phage baseplate upper protein [Lactiplantibacillus plantarum]|uniref:BppU family phage baseplate upper protein n=1 Tax=Lactiplantibacillus plantarum TaxID=1590 RepID=UPI001038C5F5|nr:BppU family phage baseplate upper protein [Lactiplantibacillus plantarum]QBK73441.1 phage baseplate upper protein [Lactiplantibacillus plantarum]